MNYSNSPFQSVENFTSLDGWRKNACVIGDGPDARTCRLLFRTNVKFHWTTHWPSKYPEGYIGFENGERFCVAKQTIDGKRVFIFHWSKCLKVLWQRAQNQEKLELWLHDASQEETFAFLQIIEEYLGLPRRTGASLCYLYLPSLRAEALDYLCILDAGTIASLLAPCRDGAGGGLVGSRRQIRSWAASPASHSARSGRTRSMRTSVAGQASASRQLPSAAAIAARSSSEPGSTLLGKNWIT